jgi:beta-lactamase regulating signal transducer with metallopeptidase domain
MHEYIARAFYYLEVHLLYASLVWFAAWALTSLRNASATMKYWIWVGASLNFILPFGAMVDRIWTPRLSWARPISAIGAVGAIISENLAVASLLGMVWLVGALLMLLRLFLRIKAEQRESGAETRPSGDEGRHWLAQGVPVRFAAGRRAPSVEGVIHPHISLPADIEGLLTEPELDAVLLHEVTHAKRRDNLIRLIHEIGLCILWFHPLMWVTSSRLALFRELSCDESVIQRARSRDLVSALAKLANSEDAPLLEAFASSFISHRLDRLSGTHPQRAHFAANLLVSVLFACSFVAGVYGTVAHTACCFVAKIQPGTSCEHR